MRQCMYSHRMLLQMCRYSLKEIGKIVWMFQKSINMFTANVKRSRRDHATKKCWIAHVHYHLTGEMIATGYKPAQAALLLQH